MDYVDGYIDIHAHILPGVDDGSGSMEETIQMLKTAAEQNIRTIIATPHFMAGSNNLSVQQLQTIRDRVQAEAAKIEEDLHILLGNELFYSESIIDELRSGRALTLADSKYVLVEFAVRSSYETIYRGLGELIQSGYAPILAHVERYLCLYKREDLINELIEAGCYIQMNSHSISGGIFNTEAAYNRKLINQGLVHFIGSDCHDEKIRIPYMKSAVKALQRKQDKRFLDKLLIENPLNILENTFI